mmetsp:Transcript_6885/g.16336  ORF Transcript_6885/g.16336 Transcript_6885/m.16336 type:complete len:238 (+) Transcript_6885:921-1634(+)
MASPSRLCPLPPRRASEIGEAKDSNPGVSAASSWILSKSFFHVSLRPSRATWLILSTLRATRCVKSGSHCTASDANMAGVSIPVSCNMRSAARRRRGPPPLPPGPQAPGPPVHPPKQSPVSSFSSPGGGPWIGGSTDPPCLSRGALLSGLSSSCWLEASFSQTGCLGRNSFNFSKRLLDPRCCSRKSTNVDGARVHRSPSSSAYFRAQLPPSQSSAAVNSGRQLATTCTTDSKLGSA